MRKSRSIDIGLLSEATGKGRQQVTVVPTEQPAIGDLLSSAAIRVETRKRRERNLLWVEENGKIKGSCEIRVNTSQTDNDCSLIFTMVWVRVICQQKNETCLN